MEVQKKFYIVKKLHPTILVLVSDCFQINFLTKYFSVSIYLEYNFILYHKKIYKDHIWIMETKSDKDNKEKGLKIMKNKI